MIRRGRGWTILLETSLLSHLTHTRTIFCAWYSISSRQSEESWRADEALAFQLAEQSRREEDSQGSVDDAVSLSTDGTTCFANLLLLILFVHSGIICFANSIDCVVTPCGHQICCMQMQHQHFAMPRLWC
jgi:hypothetical protein